MFPKYSHAHSQTCTHTLTGTIFRFPLRTTQQAGVSRLASHAYDDDAMEGLVRELFEDAPSLLLFLKHVHRLEYHRWLPGMQQPSLVYSVHIANIHAHPSILHNRDFFTGSSSDNDKGSDHDNNDVDNSDGDRKTGYSAERARDDTTGAGGTGTEVALPFARSWRTGDCLEIHTCIYDFTPLSSPSTTLYQLRLRQHKPPPLTTQHSVILTGAASSQSLSLPSPVTGRNNHSDNEQRSKENPTGSDNTAHMKDLKVNEQDTENEDGNLDNSGSDTQKDTATAELIPPRTKFTLTRRDRWLVFNQLGDSDAYTGTQTHTRANTQVPAPQAADTTYSPIALSSSSPVSLSPPSSPSPASSMSVVDMAHDADLKRFAFLPWGGVAARVGVQISLTPSSSSASSSRASPASSSSHSLASSSSPSQPPLSPESERVGDFVYYRIPCHLLAHVDWREMYHHLFHSRSLSSSSSSQEKRDLQYIDIDVDDATDNTDNDNDTSVDRNTNVFIEGIISTMLQSAPFLCRLPSSSPTSLQPRFTLPASVTLSPSHLLTHPYQHHLPSSSLSFNGRAFCFLPLPVLTGFNVHVNGCFELSSNRRDIWWGTDMTGDGQV